MPILKDFIRENASSMQAIVNGCGIRLLNIDESNLNVQLSEIQIYGWVLLNDLKAVAQIVVRDGDDEAVYPASFARPDVVDLIAGRSNECGFSFSYPLKSKTNRVEIFVRASGKFTLIASAQFELPRSNKSFVGKNDFLFLGGADSNGLVEHISGNVRITAEALNIHSANVALFRKLKCPSVILIVPEAHVLYREYLPEGFCVSDDRPINALLKNFAGSFYYPLDFLNRIKADGIQVYTGHDSHWTEVAAHLTYAEMRKKLGRKFPVKHSYEPSILREARDLRISNEVEVKQRELETRKMAQGGWTTMFAAGILNHGNIASFKNPKGSGKCLAFGTSFSTRLIAAYADDFRELIFCYGTTIDPLMVEMVKPDFVIVELPERFVHFPSLAVPGATFMGSLIASHENGYNGISIDRLDDDLANSDYVAKIARNLILGKNSPQHLADSLELISKFSSQVSEKLAQIARLLVNITEPRVLRPAVAGMYHNAYILNILLSMVDRGEIDEKSSFIFPASSMGLAVKERLSKVAEGRASNYR